METTHGRYSVASEQHATEGHGVVKRVECADCSLILGVILVGGAFSRTTQRGVRHTCMEGGSMFGAVLVAWQAANLQASSSSS